MSFLGLYRDPTVALTTSACDWRIADLVDAPSPVTLYLVIPPSDISRTKPLVRLVLNQIGRRLTERLEGDPAKSRKHQLLMMLDEFPALGPLNFFETALAFMAGYGIRAYQWAQVRRKAWRMTMATIGEFKASRAGGWEGEIRTLSLTAKVRLEPNDNRTHPNAPNYRVMMGGFHVGDAWEHQLRAEPSRPYCRVSLDDPRFDAPIWATLFSDSEGLSAQLVWSRPARAKSDCPRMGALGAAEVPHA